jgi:hypothetical protein
MISVTKLPSCGSLSLFSFSTKGKQVRKSVNQQTFNKTLDIKSRLEDVILGQGSARSELMLRKKGTYTAFYNHFLFSKVFRVCPFCRRSK